VLDRPATPRRPTPSPDAVILTCDGHEGVLYADAGRFTMIVGLIWGCVMLRAWSQFTADAIQLWAQTLTPPVPYPRPPAPPPPPRLRSVDELLGDVFPDGVGV
jgi:hypothetical protein